MVIPSGAVVGAYTDLSGTTCSTQCQGYMLFHGSYATVNYPGASFTFAGGANAPGEIVGIYTDASGVSHGFLFNGALHRRSTTLEPSSLKQQGLTLAVSSWGSMLTPRAP